MDLEQYRVLLPVPYKQDEYFNRADGIRVWRELMQGDYWWAVYLWPSSIRQKLFLSPLDRRDRLYLVAFFGHNGLLAETFFRLIAVNRCISRQRYNEMVDVWNYLCFHWPTHVQEGK